MPDDAQPVEGQGGDEATGSPYDSYLSNVPEQAREAAEQWFRDTSKGLDAKLQEAAELKKTWEPYQEVQATLGQYPPDQLQALLAWHQQVTETPEGYREWLANEAKEAGLTPAEEQELESAEASGDLTREEVQKLIEERSQAQVQPLQQQVEQLVEQQKVESIRGEMIERFGQLEAEAGKKYSDEEKSAIIELGLNEPGDDWLDVGLDRWNKMEAMVQKRFVDGKASAPGSPLSAGGQEAFKATTDWKEASEQVRNLWQSTRQ